QSFVMVKGAALLLPAEEPLAAPGRQEQHLQLMMQLLRPQDAIRLAVRLESARPRRARYLLVVRPEEVGAEGQTVLLGVDFAHEGASRCTLGMVLPLWSDTQVFLDGDGGFSVTSGGETRIFKPISVQTMWPAAPELSEQAVRALLRDVMASADLESVTSKEVREELERRTGHSLAQHKDFIDNEMLLVLAQMDRPSRIFPHLYLGSEWNAANLEELQQNRITHILNVAREIDNFFPALFTYMNVRVYDEETAQLLPHWNDTFLFLSRVRAGGGRALVHCRMGLSRSAATVLAYAMKEFGWPLERALRHVRHCRPGVLPNPGFMRQLDFYQGILHARARGGGVVCNLLPPGPGQPGAGVPVPRSPPCCRARRDPAPRGSAMLRRHLVRWGSGGAGNYSPQHALRGGGALRMRARRRPGCYGSRAQACLSSGGLGRDRDRDKARTPAAEE
ncbi:PREDICTED: protein phosphatase Slingshot homolog 3, partial [Nipponia nippon]|uniref:protein phosphatase Slingshot homolog 3 n=1 Tax=Nipponia nippon TaxID=128390 RepID=UPI000510D64D